MEVTTKASAKQDLQDMVDDHARLGFQDGQIKTHLRERHGVLPTEVIPPPTRAAQRARERYLSTGVLDSAGMKVKATTVSGSPQGTVFVGIPPSIDRQKVATEISWATSPTVKVTELRERTWRESGAAFFSTVYRGTGPTLLDRMIHGFSGLYRELGSEPGSNFEVFRKRIVGRAEKGKFDPSMRSVDFVGEWNIHNAIDVSTYPWFRAGCETTNIQIDAEMAEIFLAGKAPGSNSWVKEFLTKPVYIDIHEKARGQRTISGIFCRPAPSLGTFSYMAVVEWMGQGYEAFIFGEYGKHDEAVVMCPTDNGDDDEGLPQEALDAIYGSIPHQVEKILAMSYMYCRTKQDARQPIPALTSMPHASAASANDKKERNKEKTHSYFRVMRLVIPVDRFGFTGKTGKSWSLDHLVSVAGHFRWQPYGAGNNLRKLIWIDAYEKGHGERHRPEGNPVLLQVPTAISPQEVQ